MEEEKSEDPIDYTHQKNLWQQSISDRVTNIENAVNELRTDHYTFAERFQTYEQRSYQEMYDISTQLQALRMQLAGSSTTGPSQEIQAFEAQRQSERQANLFYLRRGRRRSSPRANPPEG